MRFLLSALQQQGEKNSISIADPLSTSEMPVNPPSAGRSAAAEQEQLDYEIRPLTIRCDVQRACASRGTLVPGPFAQLRQRYGGGWPALYYARFSIRSNMHE
jgi:hypothetical protein